MRDLPGDHADVIGTKRYLGLALLRLGEFAEAEKLLRQCRDVHALTQPDHWSTFHIQMLLGEALLGQKQYTAAEPLLLAGYEGIKKRQATIPAPARSCVTEVLECIVRLYEATEQTDRADQWRRNLK